MPTGKTIAELVEKKIPSQEAAFVLEDSGTTYSIKYADLAVSPITFTGYTGTTNARINQKLDTSGGTITGGITATTIQATSFIGFPDTQIIVTGTGIGSTVRKSQENTASGVYSGVLAGRCSTASGPYSIVVGGGENSASGKYTLIGG